MVPRPKTPRRTCSCGADARKPVRADHSEQRNQEGGPSSSSGQPSCIRKSRVDYSRPKPTRKILGFIGLGPIGDAIVRNLLKAKHVIHVYDRNPDRSQGLVPLGAKVCMTPLDVMVAADIVFSCVSDPDVAKTIVFGEDGVLSVVDRTKAFVEMSGIDPSTSSTICAGIHDHNGRYLEAQLQGSREDAVNGVLLVLTAGDKSVFRELHLYAAFCRCVHFLGEIGQASKMNLAIQQYRGILLAGLAETMALAERSNMDKNVVLSILGLTSLSCPFLKENARAMADHAFSTPTIPVKHMEKDLKLVLHHAEELGRSLPVSRMAHQAFLSAKRSGQHSLDASSVVLKKGFP